MVNIRITAHTLKFKSQFGENSCQGGIFTVFSMRGKELLNNCGLTLNGEVSQLQKIALLLENTWKLVLSNY